MTRILLHPRLLPRFTGSRVQLSPGWNWWRRRMRPGTDGNLFHQQYDDPRDIREASVLFMDGEDVELIDPPAMHIIMELPDQSDYTWGGDLIRVCQAEYPPWCEVELVWHREPGPQDWYALPGNTCLLSDYRVETIERRQRRELDDSATRLYYASGMPRLRDVMLRATHDLSELMMTPGAARVVQMPRYMPAPQLPALTGAGRRRYVREAGQRNVLPESDVIDEIDRLVNDQVRMGPVDDYHADRYDKCKDCRHDWHGLDCVHCGCLNTDWLKG